MDPSLVEGISKRLNEIETSTPLTKVVVEVLQRKNFMADVPERRHQHL
jgi:hypothetical protein